MFSESTLNEIRARMSIVELIGEYVQLKRSGQGYVGLCPFHNEKGPSFHVHPQKQIFHCFGCHKGGNVFTFLTAIEGVNFPEAVQRLAKRTGVNIEEQQQYRRRELPEAVKKENERILAAQEWAAKYYHYLLTEIKEYRYAYDYIRGRGISDKTIKKFRLGVSPKSWNTLLTLMQKRGFTIAELIRAGLVIEKEKQPNQGYDRFRGRLMFPIADKEGNTLGFGARLLEDEENQPKYLNSPESPLFPKRRVLYGLFENGRGIRLKGEALIVEGYMDVVGLYEGGVDNAVATMGTSLTEEHCVELKSNVRRVVTIFDPDRAGIDAWHRSVHLFLAAGMFAKDLSLPDGKDPDEYVLSEGKDKFYELCEKAPRQVTKLLKEIAGQGALSEEGRAKVLDQLTPILVASRRLPDRAMLWDDISLLLNVSVAALKELSASAAPGPAKSAQGSSASAPSRPAPRQPEKKPNPLDLQFFKVCLERPEEFLKIPREKWQGGLEEPKLATALAKLHAASGLMEFQALLEEVVRQETEPWLLSAASAGLFEQEKKEPIEIFQALLERVGARKREIEIRAVSAQVKLAQRLGDQNELFRLLERLKELRSPTT